MAPKRLDALQRKPTRARIARRPVWLWTSAMALRSCFCCAGSAGMAVVTSW
jgi:hypothetical protein